MNLLNFKSNLCCFLNSRTSVKASVLLICLLLSLSVNATSRPEVITGLITFRHDKSPWGVKFFVNGEWTYNHDLRDPAIVSDVLDQIQEAGVNVIYHDLTNWANNPYLHWAHCDEMLPVVEPEIIRRGMKQFAMFRATGKHPSEHVGYPFYISIPIANARAKRIWEEKAQKNEWWIYKGKPVIKIWGITSTQFWDAFDMASESDKEYLRKFTILTEQKLNDRDHLDLRVDRLKDDSKYRRIEPYDQDIGGPWVPNRYKVTGAIWDERVSWGMGASEILDLGWYDESSDGSAWARTDATDAINGNCTTPRKCNEYPSTDWNIYFNTVKKYLTPVVTLSTGVNGQGIVVRNPERIGLTPGAEVTLTAMPAPGMVFTGWSGDATGLANPLTIIVNDNFKVDASFSLPPDVQKLTIVSSEASAEENSGNRKEYSYDGDPETRWANDNTPENNWITYDLGEVQNISAVKLMLFRGETRGYPIKIEVGDTNESFSELWSGNLASNDGFHEIAFSETAGRYVRVSMTGLNSNGHNWFSIYETEILQLKPDLSSGRQISENLNSLIISFMQGGINVSAGQTPAYLEVINLTGRILYKKNGVFDNYFIPISTPGLYLVRVRQDGKVVSRKIIVRN